MYHLMTKIYMIPLIHKHLKGHFYFKVDIIVTVEIPEHIFPFPVAKTDPNRMFFLSLTNSFTSINL